MRKCFALTVVLLWAALGYGQKYSFIQKSVNDGLAQSQVKCMFQDARGYLWCGTLGGVSRFDGGKFENYSRQDGLFRNQVSTIAEDASGAMYFGAKGGISIFYGGRMTAYPFPLPFQEAQVHQISSYNNSLVIATDQGLLEFRDREIQTYLAGPEAAQQGNIIKIIPVDATTTWWITKSHVLQSLEGDVEVIYPAVGQPSEVIFDAELDRDGVLWVACKDKGLVRLGEKADIYGVNDGLLSSTVVDILIDGGGAIWMATQHGLSRLKEGRFKNFTAANGGPIQNINVILEDQEGNMWLGTDGGGIVKFAGEDFPTFTSDDGLCGNAVMSIAQDQRGRLWFSSYEEGICVKEGEKFVAFDLNETTSNNNRFWTSASRADGQLWFGASNGLFRYDGSAFHRFGEPNGLSNRKILSLFVDVEDNLWIGTTTGLDFLAGGSNEAFKNVAQIPKCRVRGIAQQDNGTIWLATNTGVHRVKGENYRYFNETNGISDQSTYCVEIDAQQRAWVGTGDGISVIEGDSISTFRFGKSFGSNVINFLKRDGEHMIVGTNDGLFFIPETSGYSGDMPEFRHFSLHDGLTSTETNLNAAFIDAEHQLWFGSPIGVVCVALSNLENAAGIFPPKTIIEQVDLNLEKPDWELLKGENISSLGLPQSVEIPHHLNHLTFHYTGISTTFPDDVRFRYMLDGLDDDWQPATTSDFVNYSSLPYDSYTFKVKAIGKHGEESDLAEFHFSVLPPFWLTWWFIALEVLAVVVLVLLVYNRRKKALLTEMELERFEFKSKLLALEQQSLNSSMNRHFIFNALNSIQYYINRKDRLSANKYLSAFAKLIRMNLDSTQNNVTSLREEVERLELYLQLEHMRFQDKFEFTIVIDPLIDQDSVKVPSMLLQPFLENSIWHGILPNEKLGLIQVDVVKNNGNIEFCIRDNGIGIETSLKKKQDVNSHVSQGMNITIGRIELINRMTSESVALLGPYEIRDDSNLVIGTEVRIILPVNFHEFYPN
jgi:ligand-binding sensor domain-containing protein